MKKITIIELVVAFIFLTGIMIYFLPQFLNSKEDKTFAQIKAGNAVFTSKVIEEFARNKNALPSDVAKLVAEQLNTTEKNPYDSNKEMFSISKDVEGCSNVEYDDNLKMIIITTLDKKGALVARTVISPPSFVTYFKDK